MSLGLSLLLAATYQLPARCEFEPPASNARAIQHQRRLYCFNYTYPAAAAAIPRLHAWLRRDAAGREARLAREARENYARRADPEVPDQFPAFDHEVHWGITADTPVLLVLAASVRMYTGGAHEGFAAETLMWDRGATRRIAFGDLFTDREEAYRILHRQFCPALLAMQVERGHEPEDALPCPDLAEQPIELIADEGRIRRAQARLAPYVAGAFVEGFYDVDLSLEPELLRLVKPLYREAFP